MKGELMVKASSDSKKTPNIFKIVKNFKWRMFKRILKNLEFDIVRVVFSKRIDNIQF